MSFNVICDGCGAPSSPSVGICPFCKSLMSETAGNSSPSVSALVQTHHEGQLERALLLGGEMHKSQPELKKDLAFVMTYAKVLLESEAPSSKIRSLLAEALLLSPGNPALVDFLEIVEAKGHLKGGVSDVGERILKSVLRRSPENAHAHFLLGAHHFWTHSDSALAIPHLETCVRLHPKFLRAWGCLGAIYKKLGNSQLAKVAFRNCAALETNPTMREFFETQSKAA